MHFFETYRDGRDYEALFDVADRRLYEAKGGRPQSRRRRREGHAARSRGLELITGTKGTVAGLVPATVVLLEWPRTCCGWQARA